MTTSRRSRYAGRVLGIAIPVVAIVGVVAAYELLWRSDDALVVYCAHDAVYAEKLLEEFTEKTGIKVAGRFDTELTKSVGLVEQIKNERNAPRCDVFWNNQALGTMELAEEGLLVPHKGPGYERIPARFKDPDGRWTGFGARLRVYIVNTGKMDATEDEVKRRLDGDLGRVAIAKPLFGTTLSHYSMLWDRWGPDKLKVWHEDLRRRGIREVAGNATVKNVVAGGGCDLGLTDTDDFFVALDDEKPVAMVPIRLDDGSAICIPNTVAVVKGTRRLGDAQKLVEFLLSAETELALANSRSRQIPLRDAAQRPGKRAQTVGRERRRADGRSGARAKGVSRVAQDRVPLMTTRQHWGGRYSDRRASG
jgi:iron(III) transport system substrate-binding protein